VGSCREAINTTPGNEDDNSGNGDNQNSGNNDNANKIIK